MNSSIDLEMPWFQSPFFEEALASERVDEKTRAMAAALASDGHLIFDPEIQEDTLRAVVTGLEGKYQTEGRLNETRRVLDAWKFNEHVRAIAAAPRVLSLLAKLYRRRPIPFQTLNFNMGTEQRTHSDTIHFDSIPHGYMCGVWIALEDVDAQNGPLHYYHGSHKLPIYNMSHLGIIASHSRGYEHYGLYEDFIERLMRQSGHERKEVHLKRGQAFLWTANLFHGGNPILDNTRTRFSQVTHYYFSDCAYFSPIHTDFALNRVNFKRVVDIATGEVVENRYLGEQIRTRRGRLSALREAARLVRTKLRGDTD